MEGSDEGLLPCVGRLEIAKPKQPLAFLCGTLPVLADDAFLPSALLPSPQTSAAESSPAYLLGIASDSAVSVFPSVDAPRYQMLPTETDLNSLPLLPLNADKAFAGGEGDSYFGNCPISDNLSRRCEALAVSGIAHYGDEIDVIAPTDILRQIFKIPYSKSRLSIAVYRVGDSLILNTGPDVEEGEKMFRRQNNPPRGSESSVFQNFAMHSVRAEACDCPPGHYPSPEDISHSDKLPENFHPADERPLSPSIAHSRKSHFSSDVQSSNFHDRADYFQDNALPGKKKQNIQRPEPLPKASQVGEKARGPVQESEKSRRVGDSGFLRVLFWKFHNFRMLLGSDLLLFSNEKYVAVSLHLWDVARQVTPLTWLEAWLDNVMASVPELAICYHQNGVIQGYELLKTDDIFLLKGISDDGTPAFHPQVVQQNGLSVLRFLQGNCKQNPGAYWLYKNAGEDVIQLFDLSVLPKSSSTDHDKSCGSFPSLIKKGRRDSLLSLGTLLYRIAHRLSLSKSPDDKTKCAQFFKKCLDFVVEQDQLVVRAYAHEQYARHILRCYRELDMASGAYLLGPEVTVFDIEEDSSVFSVGLFVPTEQDKVQQTEIEDTHLEGGSIVPQRFFPEAKLSNMAESKFVPRNMSTDPAEVTSARDIMHDSVIQEAFSLDINDSLLASRVSNEVSGICPVADPVCSKLAAIHHVSQAIKSLRWNRQLQKIQNEIQESNNDRNHDRFMRNTFSVCSCGDADCIEVCDIREWLLKSKMDNKLWKLVLLLGESYLALSEAYKDDGQLLQALKVVEISCSLYGSMPHHLEGTQFISSLDYSSFIKRENVNSKSDFSINAEPLKSDSISDLHTEHMSSSCIFWVKTWTLVGDIYVEYYQARSKYISQHDGDGKLVNGLKMSNEVVKEVVRLKKKLGRYKQNCSTCSLLNCSCQSDRVASGGSASSSSVNMHLLPRSKKCGRKTGSKSSCTYFESSEADQACRTSAWEGTGSRNFHNNKTFVQELPFGANENPGSLLHIEEEVETDVQHVRSAAVPVTEQCIGYRSKELRRGIFEFLGGPKHGELGYNLVVAMHCYDEARKMLSGSHVDTDELQVSLVKKKGWVSNELGRYQLEKKDLPKAELAFKDAIKSFREVSDHENIILINCNMGHGRRVLAEEMVSKMENLGSSSSHSAYKQSIKKAKLEYVKSIRYYEDAKEELDAFGESPDPHLSNEVCTQWSHTYLRLGMLLAKDDISEISEEESCEKKSMDNSNLCNEKIKRSSKLELSASEAFRKSLSGYESLGNLRKQEAAFAHFHFGCYHRSSCLKLLNIKQIQSSKCEKNHQKVKWYASLAERNWRRAMEFYGPKSHPTMFLTIVLELSTLQITLGNFLHSNTMFDSALALCLEVRHTVDDDHEEESKSNLVLENEDKFWVHLQGLLKKMLMSASRISIKLDAINEGVATPRADYFMKLKEMYRMSLKSTRLQELHAMHKLWAS